MITPPLHLESLEPRRAPATLVNARTVTFMDFDGDAATITFDKPVITADNLDTVFQFDTGPLAGSADKQQLQTIDLTSLRDGLSITVAARQANGGDGKVNVGFVNAADMVVGAIRISGDLGRVIVGDSYASAYALGSLVVGSLGEQGTATQAVGGDLVSVIDGSLVNLMVGGNASDVHVQVAGNVRSIRINGSLTANATDPDTGLIEAAGHIGTVQIGGDVVGGSGDNSGIRAGGNIGKVVIGGDLAGSGMYSASVIAQSNIGVLAVMGSILGGDGDHSATVVTTQGNIRAVVVKGDVVGGTGIGSASVTSNGNEVTPPDPNPDDNVYPQPIFVGGRIGSVTVNGSVIGSAPQSAVIEAAWGIGRVHLGALTGGAEGSGSILADMAGIGKVTIAGDITGGFEPYTGRIRAKSGIASVTVQGSVVGQAGDSSASIVTELGNIGPVRVAGDFLGGSGPQAGEIRALGDLVYPANPDPDAPPKPPVFVGGQIASVSVGGDFGGSVYASLNIGPVIVKSITNGVITAGQGKIAGVRVIGDVTGDSEFTGSITAGTSIGGVSIGGSLVGGSGDSSAAITANDGDIGPVRIGGDIRGGDGPGSASIRAYGHQIYVPDPNPDDNVTPAPRFTGGRIRSVTVGGSVLGGTGQQSAGIIADQRIGPIRVGKDWVGASAAAGYRAGDDGFFDTADDERSEFVGVAAIDSIFVGGQVEGTVAADDNFALLANQVGSLWIGGVRNPLKRGAMNDVFDLGTFGDLRLVEVVET